MSERLHGMGCCHSRSGKSSEHSTRYPYELKQGSTKHQPQFVLKPDSQKLPIEKLKNEKRREQRRPSRSDSRSARSNGYSQMDVSSDRNNESSDESRVKDVTKGVNKGGLQRPQRHMQRQMAEMDRMMSDPFGMMNQMMGGMGMMRHPMLQNGNQQRGRHQQNDAMDIFGGFGGGLLRMGGNMMNDPNSMVFCQSTCITMGPDGQQRVVQNSTRKAGDVRETRREVRDGEEARIAVGHHIGDRSHVIEKKRDRDGRVRQNQKFVNLDEDEAETFNQEFKNRATRNLAFDPFARQGSDRRAIEDGSSGHRNDRRRREVTRGDGPSSSAPIIEIPDDDEDTGDRRSHSRRQQDGPIIRELSDEEAEMESSKRRRGMFGNIFKH
ncbi:unnamed protein product [Bursaphelenchus okinawaensis]|uniref:Myeloid leukemia factor n=1 Tax=Bursaphelenchus okinawaensis TaxID=465554 RepID=A0A811K9V7_9BILA|nr:unnamed protein product [Bursaphelenchus okinawaensis]CAG9095446.1 unnamed protein product [Bursaphelenchus okinawaensis]